MAALSSVAHPRSLLLQGAIDPGLGGEPWSIKHSSKQLSGSLLLYTPTTPHQTKQRQMLVRALDPQEPATKKTARKQSSSIPKPAENGRGHDFVPQGSFAGYGSMAYRLPHELPEGAVVISFKLAPEVPLEWLLQFADSLQGLSSLEGEEFQGVLVRPDVYQWYALNPDLLHKPWGEACIAAQGCLPAIDYKIEANSKEDAERIERVLRPRTERLSKYEGDVLRRKLVIDD